MIQLDGHGGRVRALAFSPDGATLASGGVDRAVRLWDPATGSQRSVLLGLRLPIMGVAFSPDGSLVVAVDNAQLARTWDRASGVPRSGLMPFSDRGESLVHNLSRLGLPREEAESLCWYLRRVAPSWGRPWFHRGEHQTIRLRRAGRVENLLIPIGPSGTRTGAFAPGRGFSMDYSGGMSAAFSPGGRTLALTSQQDVLLWDVHKERLIDLRGHSNLVRTLAFAPDGLSLASAGHDGTVRIWDVIDGVEHACFAWQIGMIDAVSFAPDGMRIAAGGRLGIVIWDVDERA